MSLPSLTISSERESKYTLILVFSVFVVIIIANGLSSENILEWSDVERIAIYDEYALLGSTVTIEYYLVNDRPVEVKVERILTFTTSLLWSSEPNAEKSTVHIDHPLKYIAIPANDKIPYGSETINITKTGQLVVQKTTFPDVTITILDVKAPETQNNIMVGLNGLEFNNQDTAKLVIWNGDSHEITWGSPYTIEKQIEGEWIEVSPFPWPFAWTAECRFLPAWETRRENIKIDHLENGHYRISKTINHERTQTELTFILEFDIRDEG